MQHDPLGICMEEKAYRKHLVRHKALLPQLPFFDGHDIELGDL